MDNVQLVTRLMESPRAGPLAQGMIIQAIDQFTKAVANAPPKPEPEMTLLPFAEWQRVAKALNEELNELLAKREAQG
jgi:hypothetical protein